MARWSAGLLGVCLLCVAGIAAGDDITVRFTVNGAGWTAMPVNWSDGRQSVILAPDTPSSEAQASEAVTAYIKHERLECTQDGALYAVGPGVTGSTAGWTAKLACK